MAGGKLTIKDLHDYSNWAGRSAAEILGVVRRGGGGWVSVFPKEVPEFAHKMRNYFNELPKELIHLSEERGDNRVDSMARPGVLAKFAVSGGGVFKDRSNRIWFLMGTGGTSFHVGDGKPSLFEQYIEGPLSRRSKMPFKLVSPDGSGGSSEVIIINPAENSALGGKAKGWFTVKSRINLWHETAGSYNYSETIDVGFEAHELRDMNPHKKYGGTYSQPKIFSPLESRAFPAKWQ